MARNGAAEDSPQLGVVPRRAWVGLGRVAGHRPGGAGRAHQLLPGTPRTGWEHLLQGLGEPGRRICREWVHVRTVGQKVPPLAVPVCPGQTVGSQCSETGDRLPQGSQRERGHRPLGRLGGQRPVPRVGQGLLRGRRQESLIPARRVRRW